MVKRLPANAGDMGSVPGLERSYMRWYNLAVSLPLTPSTLFPTYDTQSLCASKMSLCKKFTHSLIQLLLGN